MKRILIVFATVFLLVAVWFGESRKFYCLDRGRCITVWKTYNNVCFIVPGKYYGIIRPSDIYLESPNTNLLTLYFCDESPRSIIVQCSQDITIHDENSYVFAFYLYEKDSAEFDKMLYLPGAKKRSDMSPGAALIDIDIRENYALNKDGKKI